MKWEMKRGFAVENDIVESLAKVGKFLGCNCNTSLFSRLKITQKCCSTFHSLILLFITRNLFSNQYNVTSISIYCIKSRYCNKNDIRNNNNKNIIHC